MDGAVKVFVLSSMCPWLVPAQRERAVGQRLGRHRAEPVVADGETRGQRGQHRQRVRGEAAHDVARHGARDDRPLLLGLPAERVRVVGDEALMVAAGGRRGRGGGAEELVLVAV